MAPLGLLSVGEQGEVLAVQECGISRQDEGKRMRCHAGEIGLRPGNVVEMLNNEGRGSVLVKVDETRIALGRGMAMKIMVRRIGQ